MVSDKNIAAKKITGMCDSAVSRCNEDEQVDAVFRYKYTAAYYIQQ